jgi:endonuclease YncB( thermonuclease family)
MGPFYRKIDGMFILAGKQPDGDSIRFKANNLNDWKKLKRSHLIKPSNVDQSVQLRLEGVDAPELHYGTARQPLGEVARDWLLNAMGFSNVTYKSDGMTVVSSQPPEVRGTILSQAAEANGRPVSYILLEADAHKAKVHNGWVYVGQDLLPSTMNARLLAASMAYLTVYSTTPDEHISLLREIAIGARNGGQGIYAADSTPLFRLVSQDDIGPQGGAHPAQAVPARERLPQGRGFRRLRGEPLRLDPRPHWRQPAGKRSGPGRELGRVLSRGSAVPAEQRCRVPPGRYGHRLRREVNQGERRHHGLPADVGALCRAGLTTFAPNGALFIGGRSMDDITAFLELSALLTGRYSIVTDTEDRILSEPIAKEYQRRLMAVFSTRLPLLQDAYKALASATPKPPIDDKLLEKLRAKQEFKDHEFVAKQIVNIWYFSQFKAEDTPTAPFLDGGFYEEGFVWPLIKAHPIGFSNQPHGYWTRRP